MKIVNYIVSCGTVMMCLISPVFGAGLTQVEVNTLQQKADQGDAEAQTNLAFLYHNGGSIAKDDGKARQYYTKAAKLGNARAQYNLGIMYHEGEGVPQDYKKALKWFKKAANQNYAHAQFNLGVMYHEGSGISKDDTKAKEWLQKSCDNHFQPACDFFKQK